MPPIHLPDKFKQWYIAIYCNKITEETLLSPHSLTKMDNSAEYDAAVSIQRKLKAMLKELDDSFPDLNR